MCFNWRSQREYNIIGFRRFTIGDWLVHIKEATKKAPFLSLSLMTFYIIWDYFKILFFVMFIEKGTWQLIFFQNSALKWQRICGEPGLAGGVLIMWLSFWILALFWILFLNVFWRNILHDNFLRWYFCMSSFRRHPVMCYLWLATTFLYNVVHDNEMNCDCFSFLLWRNSFRLFTS